MKKPLDQATVRLLWDYHRFHGDMNIRHCDTVKLENGREMYLMRFQESSGKRMYGLDMIFHGKDGDYVTEMMACEREHKKEMLAEALEVFR